MSHFATWPIANISFSGVASMNITVSNITGLNTTFRDVAFALYDNRGSPLLLYKQEISCSI